MLLRIFLIVSILAGAGIIALTHFQVKPHVESIIDERNKQTARADGLDKDLKKTKGDLATTKNVLESTKSKLSDTENQLAATAKKLGDETTRANGLKTELDKAKGDLTTAKQDLEAWRLTGLTPDQVKSVVAEKKNLELEKGVLEEEKLVLQKVIQKLTNQLASFQTNADLEATLPTGLKGTVLVVDPKWDFVVIDLGEKQNIIPNGVMMVSRDGKLIAKVKIVSVQLERSIANIMPTWKLGEVMEGDIVLSKN